MSDLGAGARAVAGRWRRCIGSVPGQWGILFLILFILVGATAANLYVARQRVEANERERLLTQARVVRENLQANLTAISEVLRGLRDDIRQRPADPRLNEQLRLLTAAMPGIRTLIVLDGQGVVQASNRLNLAGVNLAHRDYFHAARQSADSGQFFVSPPFLTMLNVYGVLVAQTVREADGRFGGLVAAVLDPKYFETLLGSVLYAEDMWTALAHGDGLQFVMVPNREGQIGKNLAQPGSFFSRHRDSGNEVDVFTGTVYATGEERMMAIQTIYVPAIGQDKPLVVAVGRDLDAVFAGWRRGVVVQATLVALIAVGSVLGLWLFRRRQRDFAIQEARSVSALKAQERFLRALSTNTPGMVAYWDRELTCRYASQKYVEWFGQGRVQIVGIGLADIMGARSLAMDRPQIAQALMGEAQLFERHVRLSDGHAGHVIVNYIPDSVDGRVEGFFSLVTDISRQKRDHEARVAAMATQRDALVREIHHRIKNTLQAVAGMLRRQLGNYHELRDPLEQAVQQVFAIASVHGLQGKADGELPRIADMLTDIVRDAQTLIDVQCRLNLVIDSAVGRRVAAAEAVPLALAVGELLRNAVKHGRNAEQSDDQGRPCVEVCLAERGTAVSITIANMGGPLPPEFDFATGTGIGTGLGLVRSLLPPQGVHLEYSDADGRVVAALRLEPPVLNAELGAS